MSIPYLSVLILFPALVGLALLVLNSPGRTARLWAAVVTGALLIESFLLAIRLQPAEGFQFVERREWLRAIGLEYHLALDGISMIFVLLTTLVFLMSLLASARYEFSARHYGLMLVLESGLLGTFTAGNFLHFFLYWELSLIPAFFLIRLHGGPQGIPASLQFFVYTMVGSVAMLIAFLALFLAAGTFDFGELASLPAQGGAGEVLARRLQWPGVTAERIGVAVFLLAFAGVAVKVPVWPLHGWLPPAYTQAPTPVTMVLTGIMSKMGVYGLVRIILPIFPREIALLREPLLFLAVVTILYGALAAFAQRDIKRLFAYSSLSHLGYCFLAVFAAAAGVAGLDNDRAAALNGAMLQSLSHGLLAAGLFAFVAFLELRNGGGRAMEHFGGLRKVNPRFAALMGIALFASLGLPGLSGFPAEFLIFKGAFALAPSAAAIAAAGLLVSAVYILTFFGRVFLGPLNERHARSADLTARESWVVLPALALTFALGLAPQWAISIFNASVYRIVRQLAS